MPVAFRDTARLSRGESCRFVTLSDMKGRVAAIVVLDDDRITLDLLRAVLADAGHQPIAGSKLGDLPEGEAADLVITDLIPLKAYSREAAIPWIAGLRARFPGTPVIIVTAHAAALAEPDRLGADQLIVKPFDVEVLLAKIDEVLAR